MEYKGYVGLAQTDVDWIKANQSKLPSMSAGNAKHLSYISTQYSMELIAGQQHSAIVKGGYSIQVVSTATAYDGPAYPHIQWLHKRGK